MIIKVNFLKKIKLRKVFDYFFLVWFIVYIFDCVKINYLIEFSFE